MYKMNKMLFKKGIGRLKKQIEVIVIKTIADEMKISQEMSFKRLLDKAEGRISKLKIPKAAAQNVASLVKRLKIHGG